MKRLLPLLCFFLISLLIASAAIAQWWAAYNSPESLLYVPKNLSPAIRHPLLVILSPSGLPQDHIKLLAPIAEKHQWIIVGDSSFKNGIAMNLLLPHILQTIQTVQNKYPVDSNKIYSCGLSGGAMGSYLLAENQPSVIKGIIANTGMMPYESDPPNDTPVPNDFPRNKAIAMIASPTDFRYKAMIKNKATLERLGWKTKWIEFTGGHAIAPAECYEAAITWLSQQL